MTIEPGAVERGEMIMVNGGCHCGAVRLRVRLPEPAVVLYRCNCSVCEMTGFLHLIVNADNFELLQGKDALEEYRFHTGRARHLFCRTCGVKSFYVPRSHPEGYSINARCLQWPDGVVRTVEAVDGRNWRASVSALPTLPRSGEQR